MIRTLLAIFGILMLAACSSESPEETSSADEALSMLQQQGFTIVGELAVPGGLEAYAMKAGTQAMTVYLAPEPGYVLIGTMVNAKGEDVAADALAEAAGLPDDEQIWTELASAEWVQDGQADAPRVIYAFTDPNCPFCNRFWHEARPWVETGKVQLRHLMVGVIAADSPAKVDAILSADDPQEAMLRNETSFDQGGIAPSTQVSESTAETLTSNLDLMNTLGFGGTPGIVFQNADGSLGFRAGLPQGDDMNTVMGGL